MLEWRENNLPVSTQFDDPYYSTLDGRNETRHVFIKGNRLSGRWQSASEFTIAELGFGTGLNFLETLQQWDSMKDEGSRLHFISFERFPMPIADMTKALSTWPDLAEISKPLIDAWAQPEPVCQVTFGDKVTLTVHIGDANELMGGLKFHADAWYLDGFSPAKNPELWNEELMKQIGKRTATNGTFATYTAAGFVKRNLIAAGFEVAKVKGFAHKRDMLIGTKRNDMDVA